jgi:hypothetical protein
MPLEPASRVARGDVGGALSSFQTGPREPHSGRIRLRCDPDASGALLHRNAEGVQDRPIRLARDRARDLCGVDRLYARDGRRFRPGLARRSRGEVERRDGRFAKPSERAGSLPRRCRSGRLARVSPGAPETPPSPWLSSSLRSWCSDSAASTPLVLLKATLPQFTESRPHATFLLDLACGDDAEQEEFSDPTTSAVPAKPIAPSARRQTVLGRANSTLAPLDDVIHLPVAMHALGPTAAPPLCWSCECERRGPAKRALPPRRLASR